MGVVFGIVYFIDIVEVRLFIIDSDLMFINIVG